MFLMQKGIKTRWINAENPKGEKGKACMSDIPEAEKATHAARDLGRGFKVSPNVLLPKGKTVTLADIEDSGVIRHIWMTVSEPKYRNLILRMYWEGSEIPSVEAPLGDFFFQGWDGYQRVDTLKVAVNPARGLNCFWDMPFKKNCKITLENRGNTDVIVFYQIDYELTELPENIGYFHTMFTRCERLEYAKDFTMLDIKAGRGKLVGLYLAYGAKNNGWWGEGELKVYMDGDTEYPTLCSTGTEDYFLGAYDFENEARTGYQDFSGNYAGFYRMPTDGLYNCMPRFGMYRVHINDPIWFEEEIRIDIQSIGWRSDFRFHPQQDDLASTVFFYLSKPIEKRPPLQSVAELEII